MKHKPSTASTMLHQKKSPARKQGSIELGQAAHVNYIDGLGATHLHPGGLRSFITILHRKRNRIAFGQIVHRGVLQ